MMNSTKSEATVPRCLSGRPNRGRGWELDESKFLTGQEVERLKETCQCRARRAKELGRKIPVRDWLIIHLALTTGLRVQEIACLNCGDIFLTDGRGSLIVRNGKGGKRRIVRFNEELKEHLTDYLEWKRLNREGVQPEDPLIKSSITCPPKAFGGQAGGHLPAPQQAGLSKRSVQRVFARTSRLAKIDGAHCFHHLRHTYASHLYRASNSNLRLVQKQLGHASVRTTQVYADVFDEDTERALEKLYK